MIWSIGGSVASRRALFLRRDIGHTDCGPDAMTTLSSTHGSTELRTSTRLAIVGNPALAIVSDCLAVVEGGTAVDVAEACHREPAAPVAR
jgi:hypothetical protein